MKLNKYIAIIGLTLSLNQAKAQLTYGNEQFLFNPVMVNPSFAGMHNNQIKLGYDARWLHSAYPQSVRGASTGSSKCAKCEAFDAARGAAGSSGRLWSANFYFTAEL